ASFDLQRQVFDDVFATKAFVELVNIDDPFGVWHDAQGGKRTVTGRPGGSW
ncbi:MAG: hypothetical protein RLZZ371_1715, partial [Pseudomonadota bacterium]